MRLEEVIAGSEGEVLDAPEVGREVEITGLAYDSRAALDKARLQS